MSANADIEGRVERRDSYLELRGVRYCIHEWGDADAPLFVYLHGWGDTATTFQFVVDALERRWRIVAPDWRGFGDSRVSASSYWFPDYLADLDEILHKLSPGAPVALVGHSMGANIAGLYAGTMPERVSAFVNIEGFGLTDADPADAPDRYRAWLLKTRKPPRFSDYESFEPLARLVRERSPRMSRQQADFVARCWARRNPDGRVRLRLDPLHKLPNPVLYRRREAEACWARITAPVLLVSGSDSDFRRASFFPNAMVDEIEAAGHMLHFEAPGPLARTIEAFLHGVL